MVEAVEQICLRLITKSDSPFLIDWELIRNEKCNTRYGPDLAYQTISTFGTVPTASKFDKSSRVCSELYTSWTNQPNHVQLPLLSNDSLFLVSIVLGFELNKLGDLTSKLNCQKISFHCTTFDQPDFTSQAESWLVVYCFQNCSTTSLSW